MIKFVVTFIVLSLLQACSGLVTGFYDISTRKHSEAERLYGVGRYYRFVASGSDLIDVGGDRRDKKLEALKILVSDYIEKDQICNFGYQIIESSLAIFEGGFASVYIHCKAKNIDVR